jgi:hypothetical protein
MFNLDLYRNFKIDKVLTKTLILLFLFGMNLSCESGSNQNEALTFSFTNSEYAQLMDDLLVLQQAISLNQVLKSTPARTLTMMDSAILQARSGLLLLAKNGEKTDEEKLKAHTAFVNALRQYEGFRVLDIEMERFDKIFNQVRFLKFELAKELGISEDQETWTVFNHNFSTSGLEPTFTTMGFAKNGKPSDEAKWFTNFQTDLPKARAQGRDGSYGWMISRPFDLSQVENPSFRYFGSYLVVAPNNVLPLSEVVRQVFKTYILLDYKSGDNPETYSDDRKVLVEYDLDDLPLGRDFDDAWTPFVSLTPYRDKTVAIGFLFDTRGINFTQYYSWTVFDFEINGSGKIVDDPVKYKEQFQGADLGLYKNFSLQFPSEDWISDNDRATLKFKADSENLSDHVDSFLLSPKLDIPVKMVGPQLKIQESFLKENFNPELLKDFEILISKDFKGGQPPVNVEWTKIDRASFTTEETSDRIIQTHLVSLTEYQGEEIVVAFRFKSFDRKHEPHSIDWSIESVEVIGQDAEVAVIDYVLPQLEKHRLAFFDFLSSSPKDYKIESEENAPQWQNKPYGFIITGFAGVGNPALTGTSRLILPEIDLTGKKDARVRLNQKVFHYKDDLISSKVITIQIRKVGDLDWTNFEVPEGTFRDKMPRDPELSSWIKIPAIYLNEKVEFSLLYKASNDNGGTVEWTFASLEVGSK